MIDVFYQADCPDISEAWVEKLTAAVLLQENSRFEGSLSIIFLDDPGIQKLNKEFFAKEKPTDVIAFSLEDEDDDVWGEVYISVERAAEQAVTYSVSMPEELARLIVHGVLHLHGYDDLDEAGKKRMTERENYYLKEFGARGLLY